MQAVVAGQAINGSLRDEIADIEAQWCVAPSTFRLHFQVEIFSACTLHRRLAVLNDDFRNQNLSGLFVVLPEMLLSSLTGCTFAVEHAAEPFT